MSRWHHVNNLNIAKDVSYISQELRLFSGSIFNFGCHMPWRRRKPCKLALHRSSLGSELAKMSR
jgi:hypothetical protein